MPSPHTWRLRLRQSTGWLQPLVFCGRAVAVHSPSDAFLQPSCQSIPKCSVSVPTLESMRLVVLLSGSGSNFQILIDSVAAARLDVDIVAAGADNYAAYVVTRANSAGSDPFVVDYQTSESRRAWTSALRHTVTAYNADVVLSSGLMRIVGPEFIAHFDGQFLNTHPALLPAFPGA